MKTLSRSSFGTEQSYGSAKHGRVAKPFCQGDPHYKMFRRSSHLLPETRTPLRHSKPTNFVKE